MANHPLPLWPVVFGALAIFFVFSSSASYLRGFIGAWLADRRKSRTEGEP